MTAADKIVENKILILVARASMVLAAPLLTALLGTTGWYFSNQAKADEALVQRVISLEHGAAATNQSLAVVETRINSGQAQREAFQDQTLVRLDRMQESIVQLSNTVAALTAVIERDRR